MLRVAIDNNKSAQSRKRQDCHGVLAEAEPALDCYGCERSPVHAVESAQQLEVEVCVHAVRSQGWGTGETLYDSGEDGGAEDCFEAFGFAGGCAVEDGKEEEGCN